MLLLLLSPNAESENLIRQEKTFLTLFYGTFLSSFNEETRVGVFFASDCTSTQSV